MSDIRLYILAGVFMLTSLAVDVGMPPSPLPCRGAAARRRNTVRIADVDSHARLVAAAELADALTVRECVWASVWTFGSVGRGLLRPCGSELRVLQD